jgi:hypothetical protein
MSLSTLPGIARRDGQAPVVEVTKSEVSAVITQQQIEMLPVANRAAVTLALLLPGHQPGRHAARAAATRRSAPARCSSRATASRTAR